MATDASQLDLVFAMDCTGSMGSYIKSATDNIRLVVDEIMTKEKVSIRLALIEYRDHPPQDSTFVTRVHTFTNAVTEAKGWLDGCSAQGGGDGPEAVADALNDALNLPWNTRAAKICILISDAPPHGLVKEGDSFPDGCPLGHDPLAIARKMAEKHITLYAVGVEPPIVPYRDFFMTLAHLTGGQYVPMVDASRLAQMIIAGVREEISLDRVMHSSRRDITREIRKATADKVDDYETAIRLQRIFTDKKVYVNRMNNAAGAPSREAEECYSKCLDMADVQRQYKKTEPLSTRKSADMDYKLEEEKTVSIEQAKRIVQKAKNWDYSAEEPTEDRNRTRCKYGDRCHDNSSYHQAKYSHPQNDDHTTRSRDTTSHMRDDDRSTRRSHDTRSSDHTIRNRETNSQTICKHGLRCYDKSDYHRAKFSHPQNDDHTSRNRDPNFHLRDDDDSTRRSHDTRSSDHTTRSRDTTSHARDDHQKVSCKYGSRCYDKSDYHREKFSHSNA